MEKSKTGYEDSFDSLEERVKAVLIEQLRLGVKEVTLDSTFKKLGIDSLDGVELVMALEEEFGIEIYDDADIEVGDKTTVRDVVSLMEKKIFGEKIELAPAQPSQELREFEKQVKEYLVVQHGVYRHDIKGVFDTKEQTIESAKRALNKEHDDYHHMLILEIERNKDIEDGVELLEFTNDRGKLHDKYKDGKKIEDRGVER